MSGSIQFIILLLAPIIVMDNAKEIAIYIAIILFIPILMFMFGDPQ